MASVFESLFSWDTQKNIIIQQKHQKCSWSWCLWNYLTWLFRLLYSYVVTFSSLNLLIKFNPENSTKEWLEEVTQTQKTAWYHSIQATEHGITIDADQVFYLSKMGNIKLVQYLTSLKVETVLWESAVFYHRRQCSVRLKDDAINLQQTQNINTIF